MKGKLDADRLKELCLNNFEKVIFAGLVFFFVTMVLAALKVEPYSKKPEQLSSACNQAQAKLNEIQEVEPVTRNYDSYVIGIQETFPDADYVTSAPWNPILSKEKKKRGMPVVLPIKNLRVAEWHGSVSRPQERNEDGRAEQMSVRRGRPQQQRSNTVGVRCCILLGEIPYAQQELEFQNKLGTSPLMAQNGMRTIGGMQGEMHQDMPMYYRYTVQRAEVPADGDESKIQEKDWVDVRKCRKEVNGEEKTNEQIIRYFNGEGDLGRGGGADIPEKYTPPELYRYVKLDSKTDPKKAGNANARLQAGMNPAMQGPDGMLANGLVPAKDASLMLPLPQVVQVRSERNAAEQQQFDWTTYLPYSKEFDLTELLQNRRGINGTDEVAANDERDDADDAEDSDDDEVTETLDDGMVNEQIEDREAEIRLFRYIDYTVERGKQYVYRVSLEMHNPNYNYEPSFNLADQKFSEEKYMKSPWSNVSSPVSIPQDNYFYLAGYQKMYSTMLDDRSTKKIIKNEEDWKPYLSLIAVRFNEEDGIEEFTEFSRSMLPAEEVSEEDRERGREEEPLRIGPGQLLNLDVYSKSIRKEQNTAGGYSEMYQQETSSRRRRISAAELKKERFETNFLLLDARGGKELFAPLEPKEYQESETAEYWKSEPGGIYSPSIVLLWDPEGEFVLHSEMEDVQQVLQHRDTSKIEEFKQSSTEMLGMEGMDDETGKGKKGRKKKSRRNRGDMGGDL